MTLYYCKTLEQFISEVTIAEVYEGSNLDSHVNPETVDSYVFADKAEMAQAELEVILCDRFTPHMLRTSDIPYLVKAHAILIWWALEVNGEGRELVRKKYEDVMKNLRSLKALVLASGGILEAINTVNSNIDGKGSRIRSGQRKSLYVPY